MSPHRVALFLRNFRKEKEKKCELHVAESITTYFRMDGGPSSILMSLPPQAPLPVTLVGLPPSDAVLFS